MGGNSNDRRRIGDYANDFDRQRRLGIRATPSYGTLAQEAARVVHNRRRTQARQFGGGALSGERTSKPPRSSQFPASSSEDEAEDAEQEGTPSSSSGALPAKRMMSAERFRSPSGSPGGRLSGSPARLPRLARVTAGKELASRVTHAGIQSAKGSKQSPS
ncbi:hypothetical protein CYMTET_52267, partial [Cymbomonas tetramitiformis]